MENQGQYLQLLTGKVTQLRSKQKETIKTRLL